LAWHEGLEKNGCAVNFHRRSLQRSPLDNVVGGNSTTSTTARGAVVSNYAGNGPGFQKLQSLDDLSC
jgi:hypothetical protein